MSTILALLLLFLCLQQACCKHFYVKMTNASEVAVKSTCESIGLVYHSRLHEASSYHACVGEDGTHLDHHAEAHGISLLRPKKTRMVYYPLVKVVTPDIDDMPDEEKMMYGWHIPMVSRGDDAYTADAYHLVADGFRAAKARISVLGSGFAPPNRDVPSYAARINAMDGSDNVYGTYEEFEHDTKCVSLLKGRGQCVDGLAPDASITAIRLFDASMMLDTATFAKASYQAGTGDIQLRTFSPGGTSPRWDVDAMDDLVFSTIHDATDRGALYVVSSGNTGQNANYSAARMCLDSTMGGFHGMITVGAFNPAGAVPYYVTRGCLFMSAPGGDDYFTISMNNGMTCEASAGTSFSAPIVAAAAAQLQSICDNSLTGGDIQDIFIRTNSRTALHDNHDVDGHQFLTNGAGITYSDSMGFGRLHIRNAIKYAKDKNCPHVSPIVECRSDIIPTNVPEASVNNVKLAFPSASCTSAKRVKYVRLSAYFSVSLRYITDFYVSSPSASIPCVILPKQHPYLDDDVLIHTGCWSFYNETVAGDWSVSFTTLTTNVDAAFSMEFYSFTQ